MIDTILVIGATGKSGRRLVPRLRALGRNVRAASRRAGDGLTEFDWAKPESHAAALDGVEALYLIAPEFAEDPAALTGPFLELAAAAGVRRVVAVTSLATQFPWEPADSWRRKLEQQVMASSLAWTILRPSGFMQNFSEGFLLRGILQADMVVSATGYGAVAFVDADDIAAVAAAALTETGHNEAIYRLTGPEALTFSDAAAVLSEVTGRTITHRVISEEEMGAGFRAAGIPSDYVTVLLNDQRALRDGAGAEVFDDVARITRRAATRFDEFAKEAAAAWRRG